MACCACVDGEHVAWEHLHIRGHILRFGCHPVVYNVCTALLQEQKQGHGQVAVVRRHRMTACHTASLSCASYQCTKQRLFQHILHSDILSLHLPVHALMPDPSSSRLQWQQLATVILWLPWDLRLETVSVGAAMYT